MAASAEPPASPPGRPGAEETRVPAKLRTAAAYAWRIIAVGIVVRVAFSVLGQFHRIAVAVFPGLVIAAVLRPAAGLLARFMPRPLAIVGGIVLVLVLGTLALVGETVADQRSGLEREFVAGIDRIERRLEEPPFRLPADAFAALQPRIGKLLSSHRSTPISTALSGASRLLEVLTVLALALFCAVFFTHSGERQWRWVCDQLPDGARRHVTVAGRAAWRTFTGYTHGILLVAATNAVLVGIALFALGVPLAVVVALIVIIGQIEGHLLHPIVMSWAVRLHPVVVALAVVGGAVAAGGGIGAVVAVSLVAVVWSVYQALRGSGDQVTTQA
ncbi:AI-2E family transporter [Streptomyces violarus]|uniref:Putative PurR-regulated permease PerM n=1 Tax=Streptomyces violarus TaxID=67380 RepID=A0A7W4ZM29_9ACTN|nr:MULTISPECIES: AI-2E family transporter [Streptomyces]MBB3075009.1 putative PurR-regulated permease PerM [Streptomyces violarus]WRT97648.1 AI-2E family transporter [Streptomyces sp. CGMCC 4.1772]GHD01846.1 AI-2E family transporter [Streptomyces violarus]